MVYASAVPVRANRPHSVPPDGECVMNGYRARAERHRRELADAASQGERIAIPHFDLITETVDGMVAAARRHRTTATEDDPRDLYHERDH